MPGAWPRSAATPEARRRRPWWSGCVVVVVAGGAPGTTFTCVAYCRSLSSITYARSGRSGVVILPTRPARLTTAIPTSIPSSRPLSISITWSMFVGLAPTTVATTFS